MREESSAAKLRSIQAFREFEQRSSGPGERSLGVEVATPPGDELSSLRVLAAVRRHGPTGVRRSQLIHELDASPAAVETALLRLLKEGLVTIQAGSEADALLVAP